MGRLRHPLNGGEKHEASHDVELWDARKEVQNHVAANGVTNQNELYISGDVVLDEVNLVGDLPFQSVGSSRMSD